MFNCITKFATSFCVNVADISVFVYDIKIQLFYVCCYVDRKKIDEHLL